MRKLAVNLLLSVSSVTFMLLGLEWAARRIDPFTPYLLIPNHYNCLRRSEIYSVEFHPRCTGELSQTIHGTNSLGMRGPEVRDDGSTRILALGDSCTWGWHMEQEQSYPAVLQELLDERDYGRYQVLNAGVPGYTSHQGRIYLDRNGAALHPAIVIIGFGWNDATTSGDVEKQIAVEKRLMPLMLLDDRLLIDSKLYRWLRYRSVGKRPNLGERVPRRKYVENLEAMIGRATEYGARALLINFWTRANRPVWHDSVSLVAERSRVPMVVYDDSRIDLVHPTVEGHRWLAERIVSTMAEAGYLK